VPQADQILRYIEEHPGRLTDEILTQLGVPEGDRDVALEEFEALTASGEILLLPASGWDTPKRSQCRVGRLRLSRDGTSATVRVAWRTQREEVIYVAPENLRDAFPGDQVLVRVTGRAGARRLAEGQVIDIVRRTRQLVPATFHKEKGETRRGKAGGRGAQKKGAFAEPTGPTRDVDIYLAPERTADMPDGQRVLVRLLDEPGHGIHPQGEVVSRLAPEGTYEGDLQLICSEFELPTVYPPEGLSAAEALPDVPEGAEWPDRTDVRGVCTFTIDPDDAKDFDDAISLEKLPGGAIRLGVHIADVSHFVPAGSLLDGLAAARGTSIYLPGHVLPMLPERISNNLCSLRPEEDRLAKTVRLTFDATGNVTKTEILRSVIRSQRRLTYDEALDLLERLARPETREGALAEGGTFAEALAEMAQLRDLLTRRRRKRGALSLDIPKLSLKLDPSGKTVELGQEKRDPAHTLIEEFMLEANEAVAGYCVRKKLPVVGRIHPEADDEKLELLQSLLANLGFRLGGRAKNKDFQKLVEDVKGDVLSPVIQLGLLRTMGHAEYVSGVGLHFALATSSYCHFTSPIRRYPDLLVHQVLEDHLRGVIVREGKPELRATPHRLREYWEERLTRQAERSSGLERRAEEAEREMSRLRLIRYLEGQVGQEMAARIVSVHPFGFFVRVEETLVEGLVHVSNLSGDYFEYDAERLMLYGRRRGRKYSIGDPIRVVLEDVDPDLREISFRCARKQRAKS